MLRVLLLVNLMLGGVALVQSRPFDAALWLPAFLAAASVVEPVLIATTASELASQLQQSWLPDGGGLVVVYESDNRSLGFGREVGGGEGEDEFMGLVPAHATAAILRQSR